MNEPNAPQRAARSAEPRYSPNSGGINRGAVAAAAAVLIALAVGGGWYWWQKERQSRLPPLQPATALPAPAPVAAATAPAASEPVIQHPIEEPAATVAEAPRTLDQSEGVIAQAILALLGSKPGASMVRRDDFVRRAVVTIDNLGRTHAAPRLWPVDPMPGKFAVQREGDKQTIAPVNNARYSPFVTLAESLDTARVAALYKQHYALFQAAYKELGYPRDYFNDRLVAVIDQLLATPEPAGPLAVRLTEVKGEVASTQPWTRYEFADPQLEALPPGSKMLLRMGNDNARRIKAKLRELRAAVATGSAKN